MKVSPTANINYLAQVVKLGAPVKHPNADKLQIFLVQGNRVISDMSKKEGDICIYFPVESQLNPLILSTLNLYASSDLNSDNTIKGYFDPKGRVKAIKLRGEPSQGILLPVSSLEPVLGNLKNSEDLIGQEFDTWNDIWVCKKYIIKPNNVNSRSQKNFKIKESRILPEYFKKHIDTPQLRKCITDIKAHDYIVITKKLHGTSFVIGNVPVKRKLSWLEKLAKRFGVKVNETEYDAIYSSRNVIKNEEKDSPKKSGFYETDVYGEAAQVLKDSIPKDYTLYGEIIGYESSGKMIQKDYDYGYNVPSPGFSYKEGEHFGIYIYRITHLNNDGKTIELSYNQIKQFCQERNINYVPSYYEGSALGYCTDSDYSPEHLLEILQEDFLEQDCNWCVNEVPDEGIVVRVSDLNEYKVYKLKSFRFLEKESALLDKEVSDLESEN